MDSSGSGSDHEALIAENARLKEEITVLRQFIDSM